MIYFGLVLWGPTEVPGIKFARQAPYPLSIVSLWCKPIIIFFSF